MTPRDCWPIGPGQGHWYGGGERLVSFFFLLNLPKLYRYPFQLQNSSSSSVSCFKSTPPPPWKLSSSPFSCFCHDFLKISSLNLTQDVCALPCPWWPNWLANNVQFCQTLKRFNKKIHLYNLNWKPPRTRPGLWGTQQRFVWLPSSPGMRPRPSGETWYARWGTLSSQRQRQQQQQRQRQDNGNQKGKDKDSNKDNGKDKDNNRDQDRVGKHESQGRFFFASWMFQADIASIHNVFSCIVDKLCNLFIHNVDFFFSCGSTQGVWQSLSMMTLLCPCPSMIPRLLRLLLCEMMKWDDDHLRRNAGVWWRWSWWWTWSLPSSILWRIPILLSQVTFYHVWQIVHFWYVSCMSRFQIQLHRSMVLGWLQWIFYMIT